MKPCYISAIVSFLHYQPKHGAFDASLMGTEGHYLYVSAFISVNMYAGIIRDITIKMPKKFQSIQKF